MKKKVIDIIPPKKVKEHKIEVRSPRIEVFNREKSSNFLLKKRNLIFILLALIAIGLFSYAYFVLPKARVEIWPQTEKLNFQTDFKIENGKFLEIEQTISQQFPATEKFLKETRAEGVIRLYNNHSTTPFPLIKDTRFVSADKKLFRTPIAVIIPGKRHEAGRWVPGTIDIRVKADRPGEDFNIGPTTFSIPGLQGTAAFFNIIAKSAQPMTGGVIEESIRVSKKDLENAENVLNVKTEEVCFNALKNATLPGGDELRSSSRFTDVRVFDFFRETIEIKILEKISNVEIGTEIQNFDFGLKVSCQVLTFEKTDIKNFAKEFIEQQIPENKVIVPESLEMNTFIKEQDVIQGTATVSLELIIDIYSDIDKLSLQNELVGKSLIEAENFLKNKIQINRIYVRLWPFWVQSVPEDLERIKIELKFGVD